LFGYLGPAITEPDYAAVKVLAALMGGGMAGRLFVELRDREGLAYSLGVVNPSRRGPAPFVAYLGTARENTGGAEAGMLRELERIRSSAVSDAELERAKTFALATLSMDRRTNARWAWYLAFFEAVGAGWDFPDRYARAVRAVTVDDVARVARQYLVRPTIVVLEPR
jgi:predicted Zn-dependent peptidase